MLMFFSQMGAEPLEPYPRIRSPLWFSMRDHGEWDSPTLRFEPPTLSRWLYVAVFSGFSSIHL